MSIQPDIDEMTFTEIVGDIEIPCDWMKFRCCSKGAARWVASLTACTCGASGVRLICDQCHEYVLTTEEAAECGTCGTVVAPFRHVVRAFEPLERR